MASLEFEENQFEILELLTNFRKAIQRWHEATILPVDQLVLVCAQDLVLDDAELAIIHKISAFIKSMLENNPHWSVMQVMDELIGISKNSRGFANFSQKEDGFDPDNYKGKVIVATAHKSKGLEWDKVFLTSANNYDYPSGADNETFMSEKYFIANQRNLEAELLYDLEALRVQHSGGVMFRSYDKQNARDDIARERLRLFYVGMTRARKSRTITWNTGKGNKAQPCLAFQFLLGQAENND